MGLKEKKFIKQLQDEIMPESTEHLKSRHNVDVTYDADWDTFSTLDQLMDLTHQGVGRVQRALDEICGDDMGKEAIAEEVKNIIFKNVAGADKALELAGGTLTVSAGWCEGHADIFTDSAIKDYIENAL